MQVVLAEPRNYCLWLHVSKTMFAPPHRGEATVLLLDHGTVPQSQRSNATATLQETPRRGPTFPTRATPRGRIAEILLVQPHPSEALDYDEAHTTTTKVG
ncbi:hypothetical protein NDU88_001218 [Pleurodeles waltl]|uniref:Uncharacterized protein n=1 Tax=Pleurodeles waltl TaxID=8319 RepID=A0AAV7SYX7_PLEWA|nr:hypothetical protein NDU88_001218 [Pleurodeles waltl]